MRLLPETSPLRRPGAAFAAVVALHLTLVLYFAPPDVLFAAEPVYDIDYPLHYYQLDRARRAFAGWGKLWGYDPLVLAGYPAGTLEDLSSKSTELMAIALCRAGLHPARAFNLIILLVHLLVPLVAYGVARLFRLTARQATGVALAWVLLWFFDSFLHWSWFCGMITWAAASYFSVLLLALAYRAVEEQRPWQWCATGALAALLGLLHHFAALILLVPCIGLLLRERRRLRAGSWVAIGVSLSVTVAASLISLLPAVRMRHYVLKEDTFLHPTLGYVFYDFLDLIKQAFQTGPSMHTALRVIFFGAAGICLWRWQREGDRRVLPLFLFLASGVALAYGGAYLHLTRITQPYRQIGPAVLLAAVPAVVLLSDRRSAAEPVEARVKALLGLALLLIVPRLVSNVVFYFPELFAERTGGVPTNADPRKWSATLSEAPETLPISMRAHGPGTGAKEVRTWLEQHLRGRGRVVVENLMLGEYLAATSRLPLLGGFRQRSFPHGDAHLFRLNDEGYLAGAELRRYLERYAVRYVVLLDPKRRLERRKDLLVLRTAIGFVRIYETRIDPSYFLHGSGTVVDQAFNRIAVDEASGAEVVLRFHWMETLRCRPGCRVERYPVSGDRVGFIRVERPPRRFEIYNSYRFDGG
jgi:hypothetical protein